MALGPHRPTNTETRLYGNLVRQTVGDIMHEPADGRAPAQAQLRVVNRGTGLRRTRPSCHCCLLGQPGHCGDSGASNLAEWPAMEPAPLRNKSSSSYGAERDLMRYPHGLMMAQAVGAGAWLATPPARHRPAMEPTVLGVAVPRRLRLHVFPTNDLRPPHGPRWRRCLFFVFPPPMAGCVHELAAAPNTAWK